MSTLRKLISRRRTKNKDADSEVPSANNTDYVSSMYALGEAKARIGLLDDAVACWTRAVIVARRQLSNDRMNQKTNAISEALINIGDAFATRSMFDEALAAWNEALQAKRKCLDTEWHPEIAQLLNKIGVAFCRSTADGDHTFSALMAFEKALEIQQDTLGPGHKDCVETANNLFKLLDGVRRCIGDAASSSEENNGSIGSKQGGGNSANSNSTKNKKKSSIILMGSEVDLAKRNQIQIEEKTVNSDEEGTVDSSDEELSQEGMSLDASMSN